MTTPNTSMSVDELDNIDYCITKRIQKDAPGIDGTLIEMRLRLTDHAKQAIEQYALNKQVEEVRNDRIITPLIGGSVVFTSAELRRLTKIAKSARITELEKQLETKGNALKEKEEL